MPSARHLSNIVWSLFKCMRFWNCVGIVEVRCPVFMLMIRLKLVVAQLSGLIIRQHLGEILIRFLQLLHSLWTRRKLWNNRKCCPLESGILFKLLSNSMLDSRIYKDEFLLRLWFFPTEYFISVDIEKIVHCIAFRPKYQKTWKIKKICQWNMFLPMHV